MCLSYVVKTYRPLPLEQAHQTLDLAMAVAIVDGFSYRSGWFSCAFMVLSEELVAFVVVSK